MFCGGSRRASPFFIGRQTVGTRQMMATNRQASVAGAFGRAPGALGYLVLLCGIAFAPAAALGQASGSATSAAHALMKRGLHRDAINVLTEAVKHTPEAKAGKEFLMLGESYYALKRYGDARPWFAKARTRAVDTDGKTLAEYRLACIAYRLGDAAGARKQTDAFVKAHPSDRRSGILLIFRMKQLARRGKNVEPQIEALYKKISAKGAGYGSAASLAASKVLTDFYLRHGLEEKA